VCEVGGWFNKLEGCYIQQQVRLNVWLNEKVVDLTQLDNTQKNCGLPCAVLNVMSLWFVHMFTFSLLMKLLCSVDISHYFFDIGRSVHHHTIQIN